MKGDVNRIVWEECHARQWLGKRKEGEDAMQGAIILCEKACDCLYPPWRQTAIEGVTFQSAPYRRGFKLEYELVVWHGEV